MALLVLGVVLFAGIHLVPSLALGVKESALAKMGEGGYKGLFSLSLLAAFTLIIVGWRSSTPSHVYVPPAALHQFAIGLAILAFWIMTASNTKSRIRQFVRHPQLTGVVLWGIAHLLLNGDSRGLILFGGLVAWSVAEIAAINKREGAWTRDEVPGWGAELLTLVIAAISVGVIIYIHPWISGVPVRW